MPPEDDPASGDDLQDESDGGSSEDEPHEDVQDLPLFTLLQPGLHAACIRDRVDVFAARAAVVMLDSKALPIRGPQQRQDFISQELSDMVWGTNALRGAAAGKVAAAALVGANAASVEAAEDPSTTSLLVARKGLGQRAREAVRPLLRYGEAGGAPMNFEEEVLKGMAVTALRAEAAAIEAEHGSVGCEAGIGTTGQREKRKQTEEDGGSEEGLRQKARRKEEKGAKKGKEVRAGEGGQDATQKEVKGEKMVEGGGSAEGGRGGSHKSVKVEKKVKVKVKGKGEGAGAQGGGQEVSVKAAKEKKSDSGVPQRVLRSSGRGKKTSVG